MKIRLRFFRLSSAVMLSILAWLLYSFWPIHLAWRLNGQTLLGCNANTRTVYTTDRSIHKATNLPTLQVYAHDLQTSELTNTFHFSLALLEKVSPYYRLLLSPDASLLAVFANGRNFVQLLRVPDGKPANDIFVDDPIDSLGFSNDSKLLSVNTRYSIRVWNTQNLKMIFDHSLDNPRLTTGLDIFRVPKTSRICFNENARYLAVDTKKGVHVFDLSSKNLVGIADISGKPCLRSDGTSLAVLSFISLPIMSRFNIDQNGLHRVRQSASLAEFIEEYRLDLDDKHFTTIHKGPARLTFPPWIPASLTKLWHQWNQKWGWPHLLRFRDQVTGAVASELTIPLQYEIMTDDDNELRQPQSIMILQNQGTVLVQDKDDLAAWNTNPHRQWYFWFFEALLVALILYLLLTSFRRFITPVTQVVPR